MATPIMSGNRAAQDYLRRQQQQIRRPYGVTQVPVSRKQANSIAFMRMRQAMAARGERY